MRLLGIDPGTASVGWGVIDCDGPRPVLVKYGCITTPKDHAPEDRLAAIYREVGGLFTKYEPQCVVIEALIFGRNITTAIPVAQARGVILLAAQRANVPISEYSNSTIKKVIARNGRADKKQVQQAVKDILGLERVPRPDDAADGCAIALTHFYTMERAA